MLECPDQTGVINEHIVITSPDCRNKIPFSSSSVSKITLQVPRRIRDEPRWILQRGAGRQLVGDMEASVLVVVLVVRKLLKCRDS